MIPEIFRHRAYVRANRGWLELEFLRGRLVTRPGMPDIGLFRSSATLAAEANSAEQRHLESGAPVVKFQEQTGYPCDRLRAWRKRTPLLDLASACNVGAGRTAERPDVPGGYIRILGSVSRRSTN
jgi:hypothetical protein